MTKGSDSNVALIKHYLREIGNFKFFYIACLILFLIAAFLFNKYATRLYEVEASIGPVQNNASSLLSSNDLFLGLQTLQSNNNIENGINHLMSFPTVYSVINNMGLEIGYFREKKELFRQTTEIYSESPFIVIMDKSHIQPIDMKFQIDIYSKTSFRLYASQGQATLYNYLDNKIVGENIEIKIDTICNFNEVIKNKNFKFSVMLQKDFTPAVSITEGQYYFSFYHLDFLTEKYLNNLKVELLSPKASIVILKFRGHNLEKIVTFLNKYIDTILEENLAKKNKIARSTINFIDSQISEISDSLVESESNLRNYKSANQVMDLSFQGRSLYDQQAQIEAEKAELQIQVRYYNYIINNFKNSHDMSGVIPPSSMNVTDPIMNQLISELISLYSQRSGIQSNNSERNLFIGQIDNKIKVQKETIIEFVTNNLNTLTLSLNELNYRSNKLTNEISKMPRTELNMVDLERKYNLSDVIYTYLLQKRSEAAIAMASNYPDYEVIEQARPFTRRVLMPREKLSYFVAIFMALLIPSSFIGLKDYFNNRITGIYDIVHILKRSAIGTIYTNSYKSEAVVKEAPKSAISESFRRLRSNLFLQLKQKESKVILVTSAQPKDGKSFVSFNLAASIASVGLKTILIDCDLHKPTLHQKFNKKNSIGISNFMAADASAVEIIQNTSTKNLSFISAGPLSPNPSELIESGALDELIVYLQKEYEYIIIDTSPVGLIVDALQLIRYASEILLVSRLNYTRKDILGNVVNDFNSNKISNYDVVLNGVNMKSSPYKNYSSYYIKRKAG